MILVGENINIMSKTIGPALRERQAEPIKQMALAEVAAGVDFLDLNIGPARKTGDELMVWLVDLVQSVTSCPLSLDTTNVSALEAGLAHCRAKGIINSISLQPERIERLLPLASKHHAYMIGLLWGPEGMPRDANERCLLAVNLVYQANQAGIPNEDIFIDPILTPVCVDVPQIQACMEFMAMLGEIAPGCKSIVGLSNVSNGAPPHLRPILNRTCLMMLMKYGITSAIVDALDSTLISIARGERQDLVDLVHGAMEGKSFNIESLGREERDYLKTTRVLTGETLYSASWLEV